eukprot:COSAG01_NODE_5792_length_4032_cov_12.553776_6_plen_99_part_00
MCYLFSSIGKVKSISGCVSGGAPVPAPTPTPFSGETISLAALGLDTGVNQTWQVRSVWDGLAPVLVINGSFVSRPSYHDAAVYVVSPTEKATRAGRSF